MDIVKDKIPIIGIDNDVVGTKLESLSIVNETASETEVEVKVVRSECSPKTSKEANLNKAMLTHQIVNGNDLNQVANQGITTLTPITVFKTREGIRTPMSGSRLTTPKRNSLTPNPQNFLRKTEDPVAQRIISPKPIVDLKQSHSNVPKSAIYFHQIVEKEESKFKVSCERWNKVLEEGSAPEEAHGNILAAIGQALLFQNKRFKQFKELIELHKDKTAEKAAYASDLDGFWEMIYYQVEDVHKRFAELELLKSNNWEEKKVEPILIKPTAAKNPIALKVKPKEPHRVKKNVVSSKFKMFRQQMIAKKQVEAQSNDVCMFVCD